MTRMIAPGILLLILTITMHTATCTVIEALSDGTTTSFLESSIFYTSFVPIIYEFEVPHWREDDLRIKWPSGHSTNCNTTESPSWTAGAGCASVYHYNFLISDFFTKTRINWSEESPSPQRKEALSCDEITPHFSSLNTAVDSQVWSNYWTSLTSCPVGSAYKESPSKQLSKLDLTKLDFMLNRFHHNVLGSSLYNHYSLAAYSGYTNAYSAYQSVGLLFHYIEMNKWKESISQCSLMHLPRPLITQSKLVSSLSSLKVNLINSQVNFSISDSTPSLYFTLPLTNCFYSSTNTSFVIRTLAPVRPSKSNFKLVELKTIPFALEFNSSLESNLICSLVNVAGKYILEETNNFMAKTDCKSSELCFVPNIRSWTTVDPCISAVFAKNLENIKAFCKSKCYPVSTSRFPLFTQISSDKYIIVGHSKSKLEIFISCRGNPFKIISPVETGAVEVTLACGCKIVYQAQEYPTYQPCGPESIVRHLTLFVSDESYTNKSEGEMVMSTESPFLHKKEFTQFQDTFKGFASKGDLEEIQEQILNLANKTNFNIKQNQLQFLSSELPDSDLVDLSTTNIWFGIIFCILIAHFVGLITLCVIVKKQSQELSKIRVQQYSNGRVTFRNAEKADDPMLYVENEYGIVN